MTFLKRFGGVKVALIGIVAAAVVGYAGYRLIFARTGEAAAALIPADASVVVTLDTHPSQSQLAAFTTLSNALKREGLDTEMEKGVNDIIGKAGLADEVRQYLTHNLASAWWSTPNQPNGPTGIVLLSISNPDAVSKLIATGKAVEGGDVAAYSFGNEEAIVAVVGDYLAISKDVATLKKVVATKNGAPSIIGERRYQEARAALPEDANLMVFVSPSALTEFVGPKGTDMYMAYGASLRSSGIQFDYRGPVDKKTYPALANLSEMAAIDPNLLKKLPPDALGLIAQGSLDKYANSLKSTAEVMTDASSFNRDLTQFEKETGISMENDVLPAFRGDTVLAVYPDRTSTATVDALMLIDTANGGNPAPLFEKFRAFIERKSAEEAAKHPGKAVKFVESKVGKTTIWKMDDASLAEFRKGLGTTTDTTGQSVPNPYFTDKSISFAVSDGSVIVATSDAMMGKALITLGGDRSLADDQAFMDMIARTTDQDQFIFMCALSRVLEHFREDLQETMKSSKFTMDDVIALFGGPNTGMVGSYHIKKDAVQGSFFLPLDYDRLAKVIRGLREKSEEPAKESTPIREIPSGVSDSPPMPGTMQVR